MTNQEAVNMLKAKIECMKRETSGIDSDCNDRYCDNCDLCYAQGTMGEQKEALRMAIDALQTQFKQTEILAHALDGSPLLYPCSKLYSPEGWCREHCKYREPAAECWLKYAEVMVKEQEYVLSDTDKESMHHEYDK